MNSVFMVVSGVIVRHQAIFYWLLTTDNRLLFFLPLRPMETTRQLKSARLIQKEMAEIFLAESRGLFGNVMITVTVCRMSADLGVAKIYVSLFQIGRAHV